MDEIRRRLHDAAKQYGNPRAAAVALGIPYTAVRRVLAGGGLRGANYVLFRDALGIAEPVQTGGKRAKVDDPRDEVDPLEELIRTGQAEQAEWVLLFAARVLEAGAKRLRQAVDQHWMLEELARADAAADARTRAKPSRRRAAADG